LALSMCRRVMKQKESDQTVVACGGIASGEDVYQFLQLGVPAVQLYTGLVYHGPFLIRSIKEELSGLLKRDGTSVADVVRTAQAQPIGL
jgi:dihydroorotate dehydrogenase